MATEVIIVGASAAGLSVAAELKRQGVSFVVLEQHRHVGHAWRNHYERLHLHTHKAGSNLPGYGFGSDVPQYAPRDRVVEYLEAYREHFGIEPNYGESVSSVRRGSEGWEVSSSSGSSSSSIWKGSHVVVATGYNRKPHVPSWPGQDLYGGEIFHSSKYANGEPWRNRRVLVVGFGNSGGEIAIDLVEHGAKPDLAVRSPVNVIPRDVLGVPVLGLGIGMAWMPPKLADLISAPLLRITVGDITKLGLRKLPYGPTEQIHEHKQIPLLDIGTLSQIREGNIGVVPGLEKFHEAGVVFVDGDRRNYDAVVLATGYRPAVEDFVENSAEFCDDGGVPGDSGREIVPGLYFCGFYLSPTGMLREIGIEARRIAQAIARCDN